MLTKKILLLGLFGLSLNAQDPIQVNKPTHEFMETYCIRCHGPKKQKGGVRFDDLESSISNPAIAQRWQDVLDVLNVGEMPPEDVKQPSKHDLTEIIDHLSQGMIDSRNQLADTGGRPTIRRINKREYKIIMKELLGQEVDLKEFPDDDLVDGFDTVGGALTMSSLHLNKFLTTSQQLLTSLEPHDEAVKTQTKSLTYKVKKNDLRELYQQQANEFQAKIDRGEKKHPDMNAKEIFELKPRDRADYPERLKVQKHYAEFKTDDKGFNLYAGVKNSAIKYNLTSYPEGDYILRLNVSNIGEISEYGNNLRFTTKIKDRNKIKHIYQHVPGAYGEKQALEIHFTLDHKICSEYNLQTLTHDAAIRKVELPLTGVALYSGELIGPLNQSRDHFAEIFFKGTQDNSDTYAQEIITRFAKRAYRNQAADESFLKQVFELYQDKQAQGHDFISSIKTSLSLILSSPRFIYSVEQSGEKTAALNELELVNRLARFLWSSTPDQELYDLADQKLLYQELSQQIDRMLASPKADAFYENFISQWLELDRLDGVSFINVDFNDLVRKSAKREPIEFFKLLVKQNLSLSNCLDSDFAVINSSMAKYYGIPGVDGMQFRQVPLEADSIRGGLVTQAAILGLNSDGELGNPFYRGAFAVRKLLNSPPPMPPPNVPLLQHDESTISTRELIKIHTEQATCASCHRRFDSIGMALENFDASGLWREQETIGTKDKKGTIKNPLFFDIDTHGVMPNGGASFKDFFEMKKLLGTHSDLFVSGLAEALMLYGAGRTTSFTDHQLLEELVSESRDHNYNARDFIKSFILSKAFLNK